MIKWSKTFCDFLKLLYITKKFFFYLIDIFTWHTENIVFRPESILLWRIGPKVSNQWRTAPKLINHYEQARRCPIKICVQKVPYQKKWPENAFSKKNRSWSVLPDYVARKCSSKKTSPEVSNQNIQRAPHQKRPKVPFQYNGFKVPVN